MDLKKLIIRYVDKIVLAVVVVFCVLQISGAYTERGKVRATFTRMEDLINRADKAVDDVKLPPFDPPEKLSKQFARFLNVPNGLAYPDMCSRPGELLGRPVQLKLEMGSKPYDYGAVFKVYSLPPLAPEQIDSLTVLHTRVATMTKAAAADGFVVTLTPKDKGTTTGTIVFKQGTKIKFSIAVTREGRRYLGPPVITGLEGGRGTVTVTFHRNPNTIDVGTDKYRIERRERGAARFEIIHTLDAPKADRDRIKPKKAAPAAKPAAPGTPKPGEPVAPLVAPIGDGPLVLPGAETPAPGAAPPAAPADDKPEYPILSYTDRSVLPRKVYEYRVTAVSRTDTQLPEPIIVSSPAKEIRTLDTMEVQLTSQAGKSATFTITRWADGIAVQQRFFVGRGAVVGGKFRKKVGPRKISRIVDFSTGSALLDFGISEKWGYVTERVRVAGADGRFETISRKVLKPKQTRWAILYSSDDGSTLYWVEKARNIKEAK